VEGADLLQPLEQLGVQDLQGIVGTLLRREPAVQLPLPEDPLRGGDDLVQRERLGEEVDRPFPHRGHGDLHRRDAREDDDGHGRRHLPGLLEEVHPVHAGHRQVGEDDVVPVGLDLLEPLDAVGGHVGVVISDLAQDLRKQLPDARVVVHDEDAAFAFRFKHLSSPARRPRICHITLVTSEEIR